MPKSVLYNAGVRRSQLITTFGIGAIVDLNEYSVLVMGQDFWAENNCEIIREERLEKKLKVACFKQPKSDRIREGAKFILAPTVPCRRFPEWLFCRECRALQHFMDWGGPQELTCRACDQRNRKKNLLIPTRFVVACDAGHLNDFPWREWAHRGQVCDNPSLKLKEGGNSTALSSIEVSCDFCNSSNDLGDIFIPGEINKYYKCMGFRPWLGDDQKDLTGCSSNKTSVVQRGSAGVYFPSTESAISIPPFSSFLYQWFRKNRASIDMFEDDLNALRMIFTKMIEKNGLSLLPEDVVAAYKHWRDFLKSDNLEELRVGEYNALIAPVYDDRSSDFFAKRTSVPEKLKNYIAGVTLVHRLREVRVLKGFSRLQPDSDKMASLSSKRVDWFPAMEVSGEGLFIEFSRKAIDDWKRKSADALIRRVALLDDRRKALLSDRKYFGLDVSLSAELVLIHTFAHLLIRQLTFECGYSSSALRERIYVNPPREGADDTVVQDMQGVLIYTGTSDSDGGLGGLVRQGEPSRLEVIFTELIEQASWCSNDPLCIESNAQGMNSLNMSACHACSLLPETACEYNNLYLDRGMLIGTNEILGFFADFL